MLKLHPIRQMNYKEMVEQWKKKNQNGGNSKSNGGVDSVKGYKPSDAEIRAR